jgi:GntR family galactonate operon transcriptional repressor
VLAWRVAAQFDGKILEDIFEMRLCFEPRAAYLAVRDGTAEDHAAIRRHCNELAAAYADCLPLRVCAEAALTFHLGVIHASRNGLFITIGSAVKSALRLSFDRQQGEPIKPEEDVALHQSVAQALCARECEAAAAAMERLLVSWRRRFLPASTAAVETQLPSPPA